MWKQKLAELQYLECLNKTGTRTLFSVVNNTPNNTVCSLLTGAAGLWSIYGNYIM
jgi:hypothetical protein